MSDLISRSAMIQRLEAWNTSDDMDMALYNFALMRVLEQPTVCNIDKIVEELETHSFELGTDSIPAHYLRFNEAIEIVNQGGVSDDACEWIKYDYRTICPKNHDANNPYWRIPDNTDKLKYCPYCGKKIKIVGD